MRRPLIALAAVLAVLLPGAPAWAHNSLAESSPAEGATLIAAPDTVRLRFLQRLNAEFTTIVVSDAGKQRVRTGAPAVDDTTGTVTISQPLVNGTYTVAYRTVSVDGHVVQGSYVFTVADPAAAAAATDAAAEPPATPPGGGISGPVLIGLGVALAVLAALLLVVRSRRRNV